VLLIHWAQWLHAIAPRTGLCQQSNQSAVPGNGNWKIASRDRRPKPASKGQNCRRSLTRDRCRPAKPAGMWALSYSGENTPVRPHCVADDAVTSEPVSGGNSLVRGNFAGNLAKLAPERQNFSRGFKRLTATSCRDCREIVAAEQGSVLPLQGVPIESLKAPLRRGRRQGSSSNPQQNREKD
jgi:hypothetical protein